MKIIIIGNIAAGKSTLAKQLKKDLKYPVFSIDEYRKKINVQLDTSGENLSWALFVRHIQLSRDSIIECTGTSKHYIKLITLISDAIVIKVPTNAAQCLINYYNRGEGKDILPWEMDIKASLARNEIILKTVKSHLIHQSLDATIKMIRLLS